MFLKKKIKPQREERKKSKGHPVVLAGDAEVEMSLLCAFSYLANLPGLAQCRAVKGSLGAK